jgi:hypothetical protein
MLRNDGEQKDFPFLDEHGLTIRAGTYECMSFYRLGKDI